MEDSQTDHSADELEVIEMLRVHARVGINLQGIIIVGGIFKETVEWIEHFMREKEEEFTRMVSTKETSFDPLETYRERPP